MHHVALVVRALEACERFYCELLGMQVEWRPDPDNVYLTSGNDNLALHRSDVVPADQGQLLDHVGFILKKPEDADDWYRFLMANDIEMKSEPRTHRDGARSFYCADPEGTVVQVIFHPQLTA